MSNNKSITTKLLDWAYNKALTGFSGTESAYSLAHNYMITQGTLEQKADRLIKWQVTKSATSGFITGFGGFTMMPFAVPANIASVIYIQIRMIAAIAYMGGHDLQSDRVKSMIYICMAGNGAKELAKESGIKAGEKMIRKAAQKAVTKAGGKSLGNITKMIPLMGGIIGASFDAATTKIAGNIAKKTFINNDNGIVNINEPQNMDTINL